MLDVALHVLDVRREAVEACAMRGAAGDNAVRIICAGDRTLHSVSA